MTASLSGFAAVSFALCNSLFIPLWLVMTGCGGGVGAGAGASAGAAGTDAAAGSFESMRTLAPPTARGWEALAGDEVWDWSGELAELRSALALVTLREELLAYIVDLVRATRSHESVLVGAGPRATQALLLGARAKAAIEGRDYVMQDGDVMHFRFNV